MAKEFSPSTGANNIKKTPSLSDAGGTKWVEPSTTGVDPNYPVKTQQISYAPNKKEREVRRQVYIRYYEMRDNDWRTDAEREWEMADKEYQLWRSDTATFTSTTQQEGSSYTYTTATTMIPDPDDTRSRLKLPDAFAAIQSHMQETIGRKSRPVLTGTESSDEPIQEFTNSIMNYNMNNTDFDYQWYLGGVAAAIRGTSFYYDYYRFEQRWVQDPDDVDEEGNIIYKKRQITDFDDDYMEWIPNEFIYIDERANHVGKAVDMVRREILNIREFQRIYSQKKDFINVGYVRRGGETTTRSFFKLPKDIVGNDVEILHYYNRALDTYWVVANNITIHFGPLTTKHKELPIGVRYYYRVPGRFWGMGIPKILHMLTEERTSIRNLNMDRQNLQINKMFLHNNMFDIDEEDLVSRPHGLISVDTNGLPLNQAIMPIEYGDVPASYFKTDEIMIEDISRAIGIDLTKEEEPSATATAAALKQENYLKRIVMIATLDEMDTIIRIGRLKWSNIQFFYPFGRMDTIYEDNHERQEQVYKKISIEGKKFEIKNENGAKVLRAEDITGASQLQLTPKMAKYLEGNFDVSIDSTQFTPTSRTVQQTKVTEMFSLLLSNPATMGLMDLGKAIARVLSINDEKPKDWLGGFNQDPGTAMLMAEQENRVMAAGQPLSPTPGATEEHTLVHIMFTQSVEYQQISQTHPEIVQIFATHIMGEHEANPATNSAAQVMSANGLGGLGTGTPGNAPGNPAMQHPNAAPPPGASQAKPVAPGAIGQLPNLPGLGLTANVQNQPQVQPAGISPANLSKPTRTGV
jgi:hypothetical protein